MLNLPKTASDQEVRERYRQLSVVFHPDKQADPARKEAASQRFLQVQKAYEGARPPPFARTPAFSLPPCSSVQSRLPVRVISRHAAPRCRAHPTNSATRMTF